MKLNLMHRKDKMVYLPVILLLAASFLHVSCERTDEGHGKQLEAEFLKPPQSARPRVWWHWMNGNITKEGIRADLEWMHRIGLGGFQNFDAPADWLKSGADLWLDLGVVKNLAEVAINGKSLGIAWNPPFRINLKDALKQGENIIEIRVTNLWVNRLIGDQQPGMDKKITYTTMAFYRADSPLMPSGLLGPVQILRTGN